MADAVTTRLYTGARNIVQTMTDISDGTGLVLATFLSVAALTPNPGIHMKVRRVKYSIENFLVQMYWAGSPNVPLIALGQGQGSVMDWSMDYSGGVTNPNSGGAASGDILISAQTIGTGAGQFTITLECLAAVRIRG